MRASCCPALLQSSPSGPTLPVGLPRAPTAFVDGGGLRCLPVQSPLPSSTVGQTRLRRTLAPLKRREAISLPLKAPFPCGQHQIHSPPPLFFFFFPSLSSSFTPSLSSPSPFPFSLFSFPLHLPPHHHPRLLNPPPHKHRPELILFSLSLSLQNHPLPLTISSHARLAFFLQPPTEKSLHPRIHEPPEISSILDAPRSSSPSSLLLSAPFSSSRYARLPRGLSAALLHPPSSPLPTRRSPQC